MPQIPVANAQDLMQSSVMNDALRNEAVKEVLKDQAIKGMRLSPREFVRQVSANFIEKQLDNFPMLCDVTRYQNTLKKKELEVVGRKGRFTESLGWSENYEFKHEFEIPIELHLFMTNLVYKDFWSTENQPIWRRFMVQILKGNRHSDMETLMWAKMQYGSNSQKTIVTV